MAAGFGSLKPAQSPKVIKLIFRAFAPYDDLNSSISAHESGNAYSRGAVPRNHDGPVELDILKNREIRSLGKSHCGLGHRLESHDGGEEGVSLENVIAGIWIAQH